MRVSNRSTGLLSISIFFKLPLGTVKSFLELVTSYLWCLPELRLSEENTVNQVPVKQLQMI